MRYLNNTMLSKIKSNKSNLLIYLIVTIFLIIFVYKYWKDFRSLQIENPSAIIPITLMLVFVLTINGLVNQVILRSYNVPIKLIESISLSIVNSLGNLLIPLRGGAISNAVYLKKKYNFSYSLYLSSLSAFYVLVFWVNTFLGLVTILLRYYLNQDQIPLHLFIFFLFTFLFFSYVIVFSPQLPLTKFTYVNKIIGVINDWKVISNNKSVIFQLIILTSLNIIFASIATFFEFILIGEVIGLDKLIIYTIFSGFSILVSFTPGNIGIRESFSVYSASVLGIFLPLVIVVSIVDRVTTFVITLVLAILTSRFLRTTKKQ